METKNDIKDKVQRAGLNTWYLNGCRGTLEWATGVGKTRPGVLAANFVAERIENASILILTPTQVIRDNAWKEEFRKWGYSKIWDNNVKTVCIQTAYKYEDEHYDLVIADEIHNYIPIEDEYAYFKFFENNQIDRVLGLSASIDEEIKERLNTIAPIIDTIDVNKAVELGLVSPFKIFNVAVELTDTEKEAYRKADREFGLTFPIFNKDLNFMFSCMKNQNLFKNHIINYFNMRGSPQSSIDEQFKVYKTYPFRCNTAMRKRKEILYSASQKITVTKEISDLLSNKNGVIFSESSSCADKIGETLGDICVVEHSKIKPAKKRRENLNKFQDGRTKITRISAVRSLNEGANLKRVMFIIIASGNSKLRSFIQRVGRSIRWEDGKTAFIIRLYVKGTQEEKWVESSQEGYEMIEVKDVKTLRNYLVIN